IVTVRLTLACPINCRQRGFILALGCSKNLKLLQLVVKHAKKEHCELGVVFVDIAKAFDTICHQHVIIGLVQKGVHPHLSHLISEMYKNITTYID
ncbi:PO21 protein, partial [Cettia cetti]|nr:PO21 protein [Cettia cetti]